MERKHVDYYPGIFDHYKSDMNMEHWMEVFPTAKWKISFPDVMWGLGFEMDSFNGFMEKNPKFESTNFRDEKIKKQILDVLKESEVSIVGSFLFSFFRQRTHWDYASTLTPEEEQFVLDLFSILEKKLEIINEGERNTQHDTDLSDYTEKMENNRVIIINKMYSGDYIKQDNNIGHEIINLYKADDGKNYIYLNKDGLLNKKFFGKKNDVLLVRYFAPNVYKVLAKAENVRPIPSCDSSIGVSERHSKQVDMGLKYGGVKLETILENNLYKDKYTEADQVYATFEASEVILPSTELYITDKSENASDESNCFFIRTNKGFGKQTLREFYTLPEKAAGFADLSEILSNGSLWNDSDTTKKITEYENEDRHDNLLRIIGQEDHELAYSNFLAYIFKSNPQGFSKFAREVLGIEGFNSVFDLYREKENIDLLIDDGSNLIVIENKIKSGINGMSERHDIESELVQTQLKKYYDYATKEYEGHKRYYYIFSPDYNRLNLSKYACGEHYKLIEYSKLLEFFIAHSSEYSGVPYFGDFVKALYKHAKKYDDELETEMKRRFMDKIQACRK